MLEIFICIAAIFSFSIFLYNNKKKKYDKLLRDIKDKEIESNNLTKQKELSERELWQAKEKITLLQEEQNKQEQKIQEGTEKFRQVMEGFSKTSAEAAEESKRSMEAKKAYWEAQEKSIEENYMICNINLGKSYEMEQDRLIAETDIIRKELDKISSTRTAAIEALLKEKEIEEDLSFYCLTIESNDLDDIKILDPIKDRLHQPRILCMLIWSTYYQKPMTQLCNNILGEKTICGIYKITNTQTKECYIGQAVDVAKRWKDHAKCGLGIDTPAGNKLYKAMKEYGLYSFSWELIEECPRDQLNEKEKTFIEIYSSKTFGYNSAAGNKK